MRKVANAWPEVVGRMVLRKICVGHAGTAETLENGLGWQAKELDRQTAAAGVGAAI